MGRIRGEWEWGIRSGNRGVGVEDMEWEWWCGSGRFYNATPITHIIPLHIVPHSPIPHSTHIQSIVYQSNSAVSSHRDCVSTSGGWTWSGTNDVGTIISLSLWSGAYSQKSPSTLLLTLCQPPYRLSYSAMTFGVGNYNSILIRVLEWGIFAFSQKSLRRLLQSCMRL